MVYQSNIWIGAVTFLLMARSRSTFLPASNAIQNLQRTLKKLKKACMLMVWLLATLQSKMFRKSRKRSSGYLETQNLYYIKEFDHYSGITHFKHKGAWRFHSGTRHFLRKTRIENQNIRIENIVLWDKVKDTFGVNFQVPDHPTIKRGMLKFLASIYDPVGIISPVMLLAKDMYREECNLKLSWDQRLLEDLTWYKKWIKGSSHQQIEVPRSKTMYNE